MISMPAREAEILIQEYQSCTLQELRERYEYPLEAYSPLARLLLRIPDKSINNTGRRLILECSAANDPLATLIILGSLRRKDGWAREIPKAEILHARQHLKALAHQESSPDAMVLVGLDLRAQNRDKEARVLFESALRKVSAGEMLDVNSGVTGDKLQFKVDQVRGHDLLPIPAPWIALGKLLLEKGDLEAAKAVLHDGALKADDPMAYFYLAECGEMYSDEWLEYMTKAAASGHPDAMFHMGNFYAQSKQQAKESVGPTGYHHLKGLDAYRSWKAGPGWLRSLPGLPKDLALSGREAMAVEWYLLAFEDAHRPAAVALAQILRRKSAWWAAAEALRDVLANRWDMFDVDEGGPQAKREAIALSRIWMAEEKEQGLTFTKDVVDDAKKGVSRPPPEG
ncbi:hypothetical protein BU16DRAFT_616188 [Lophium mytilinum]|uniref:HCP-like protein n=1 Tax=Lophium mytilinum TaxID=390894 RepID=A0A6A6R2E6_9PEZI|nr:hypothetical protein BU16DRAFT_616188 [Lophium mytilinum]